MGKTKKDLVKDLEKLNKALGEDEQIEFEEDDTNKNLAALLEEGEEKVAAKEAEAKDEPGEAGDDPAEDTPAEEKPPKPEEKLKKGKYTITTCNGNPYPHAKNPQVFDTLETAERVAKFIKGTVDK